jgi:tetratricopeptide (TPR) repeat protein
LEKALSKDSTFFWSLAKIGDNYLLMKNYEKARTYYQEYFNKFSSAGYKSAALFYIANSYLFENKLPEAIKAFDKRAAFAESNKLYPALIATYWLQGCAFLNNDNVSEGQVMMNKVAELVQKKLLAPGDQARYEVFVELGKAMVAMFGSKFAEAQTYLDSFEREGTKLSLPNLALTVEAYRGVLAAKRAEWDAALAHFAKADPLDPYILYYTGLAWEKRGDMKKAKEFYTKVTQVNEPGFWLAIVLPRTEQKLK